MPKAPEPPARAQWRCRGAGHEHVVLRHGQLRLWRSVQRFRILGEQQGRLRPLGGAGAFAETRGLAATREVRAAMSDLQRVGESSGTQVGESSPENEHRRRVWEPLECGNVMRHEGQ